MLEIEACRDSAAVVFVEIRQVIWQKNGEAFLGKAVLEQIGPNVGKLCEVDVLAGP